MNELISECIENWDASIYINDLFHDIFTSPLLWAPIQFTLPRFSQTEHGNAYAHNHFMYTY